MCFQLLISSIVLFLFLFFPSDARAAIVISELYAAPATSEKEWVELFNSGLETVLLADWQLFDQLTSPSILHTFSTSDEIAAGNYFTIELSTNKLNNTQDGILLFDQNSVQQDAVYYQNAQQGQSWSTVLSDGTRLVDGFTSLLTPNEPNKPLMSPSPLPMETPQTTPSPTLSPAYQQTTTFVAITDFMACPESNSSEWVVLENTGENLINLEGWKLADEQGNILYFNGKSVSAKTTEKIYLNRNILNNSGDALFLYQPNTSQPLQIIHYEECRTGKSYQESFLSDETQVIGNEVEAATTQSTKAEQGSNTAQESKMLDLNSISTEENYAKIHQLTIAIQKQLSTPKLTSKSADTAEKASKLAVLRPKIMETHVVISAIIGGILLITSCILLL